MSLRKKTRERKWRALILRSPLYREKWAILAILLREPHRTCLFQVNSSMIASLIGVGRIKLSHSSLILIVLQHSQYTCRNLDKQRKIKEIMGNNTTKFILLENVPRRQDVARQKRSIKKNQKIFKQKFWIKECSLFKELFWNSLGYQTTETLREVPEVKYQRKSHKFFN